MSTKYTGVHFKTIQQKWQARLTATVNGISKQVCVGSAFPDEISAAKARDK